MSAHNNYVTIAHDDGRLADLIAELMSMGRTFSLEYVRFDDDGPIKYARVEAYAVRTTLLRIESSYRALKVCARPVD